MIGVGDGLPDVPKRFVEDAEPYGGGLYTIGQICIVGQGQAVAEHMHKNGTGKPVPYGGKLYAVASNYIVGTGVLDSPIVCVDNTISGTGLFYNSKREQ